MSEYGRSTLLGEKRRHRRRSRKRASSISLADSGGVDIRIGNKRIKGCYDSMRATGSPRDAKTFTRLVDSSVDMNPNDPVVICVNGYRSWLDDILGSCLDFFYLDPSEVNRQVQMTKAVDFPERSDRRGRWIPWSFVIDQMNLPEVYYWSFNARPPAPVDGDDALSDEIENYSLRMGAWFCGMGAYPRDQDVEVIIIFTQKNFVSENVVTNLLYPYLSSKSDYSESRSRQDEEGVFWFFYQLFDLLTDWENIVFEYRRRFKEADLNSEAVASRLNKSETVKLRTRAMHDDIDRIWELLDTLQFHIRCFKKLSKFKDNVDKKSQKEPIWDQLSDTQDELEQQQNMLNSLKERIDNLTDLEFNLQNAQQSADSRFLSVLGTLFLPVSFLASLFGITTVTWPVLLYLYIAVPLFLISAAFTQFYPKIKQKFAETTYPERKARVPRQDEDFRWLGAQLPRNAAGKDNGRGRGFAAGGRRKSADVQRVPERRGVSRGGSRGRSRAGSRLSDDMY